MRSFNTRSMFLETNTSLLRLLNVLAKPHISTLMLLLRKMFVLPSLLFFRDNLDFDFFLSGFLEMLSFIGFLYLAVRLAFFFSLSGVLSRSSIVIIYLWKAAASIHIILTSRARYSVIPFCFVLLWVYSIASYIPLNRVAFLLCSFAHAY